MAYSSAVGLAVNPAGDGTMDLPMVHTLNNSQFRLVGWQNMAGGIIDYPMILIEALGFAFSRRNPNASDELRLTLSSQSSW